MGVFRSIGHWASNAWQSLLGLPSSAGRYGRDIWHFISATANGADYMLSHPFEATVNTLSLLGGLITGNMRAASSAANRLIGVQQGQVGPATQRWVIGLVGKLRAWVVGEVWLLNDKIKVAIITADSHAWQMVHQELIRRRKAVALERARRERADRHVLQTVQREAASGYAAGLPDRGGLVKELADLIASRNPAVKGLTSDLVRGLLDLLAVDDPLARIALGIVVNHLIDRVAVDKPIAALLGDLAGPLLGQPQPHDLHDVIQDLAKRIGAIEGWQATFMADGGPEILQAGKEWASITSLAVDAGLLAFFGAMTVEPERWAADVSGALAAPVNDTIAAASGLLSRL